MDLAVGRHRPLERHPRRLRVDERQEDAVVGAGRHDDAVGQVRLGHRQLRAVEHPAVVARSGPYDGDPRRAGGAAGQRGRQDHLAGHDAGEPAGPLGPRAEMGDGKGAEHEGRPQRHGRHRVALRLEQQAELHEAVARAPIGLGHGKAQQVGIGQGAPELAIDAILTGLDRCDPLGIDQSREDPGRGLGDGQLPVAEAEVHQRSPPPGACRARTGAATAPRRNRRIRPAAPSRP